MDRVIVIGCPGAGKSTFARGLRDITGLPLYYLDMLWHKPDRTNVSREEFDRRLDDILRGDKWIIDGNYQRTRERRIIKCDTVFLLDIPTEVCLAGAKARVGTRREDMPWVETEFDKEFGRDIENFSRTQLPEIYALLEKYGREKSVYIFKSRNEADNFLRSFRK